MVLLIGHVGNITTHDKVVNVSICTKESFKKDEEWETKNTWHNLRFFGKTIERAKKLNPGDLIHIEGKISYNEFNEKFYTNIIVNRFKVLKKKEKNTSEESTPNVYPVDNIENEETEKADLPF